MLKTINIGNKKTALKMLVDLKDNKYVPFDIEVTNAHITRLNILSGKIIFRKDALYISSFTLWEIMQPIGKKGTHNYHGLSPEDVFIGLSSLKDPRYFFVAKIGRYAVVTTKDSHFGMPLMIIIDTNAHKKDGGKRNINKIITIYPKDNIDSIIEHLSKDYLLYIKK